MYPRQMNRTGHQRRFTAHEVRSFDRELGAPSPTTAERMAEVFVLRARDGREDTTNLDLVREGFTEHDVIKHFDEATALAGQQLRDVDVNDDRVEYDRAARVMVGANAVAGLLLKDTGAVHTACRLAGMQTAEIGNLFPDIIGEALRLVREARATVMVA